MLSRAGDSNRVFRTYAEVDAVRDSLASHLSAWGPGWRVTRPSTSSHPFLRIEFLPSNWVWDRADREFSGGPKWAQMEAYYLMLLLQEHGTQILAGRGCGLGQYFEDGSTERQDTTLYTANVERAYSVHYVFSCPPGLEPQDAIRIHGGVPLTGAVTQGKSDVNTLAPYTPPGAELENAHSETPTGSDDALP